MGWFCVVHTTTFLNFLKVNLGSSWIFLSWVNLGSKWSPVRCLESFVSLFHKVTNFSNTLQECCHCMIKSSVPKQPHQAQITFSKPCLKGQGNTKSLSKGAVYFPQLLLKLLQIIWSDLKGFSCMFQMKWREGNYHFVDWSNFVFQY